MNKQPHKAYRLIAMWGSELGSYGGYINNEQYRAWLEDAPLDSVYKNNEGIWVRLGDIANVELRNNLISKLAKVAVQ